MFPLQSLIVRCGEGGQIETTAAGIYQGGAGGYHRRPRQGRIVNQ
jgi:hypothetical protein